MRSLFRLFTQQPLAAKVPEITVMFWVVKILTTAPGEAISDYLSTGNKAVGALIEIVVFVVRSSRSSAPGATSPPPTGSSRWPSPSRGRACPTPCT